MGKTIAQLLQWSFLESKGAAGAGSSDNDSLSSLVSLISAAISSCSLDKESPSILPVVNTSLMDASTWLERSSLTTLCRNVVRSLLEAEADKEQAAVFQFFVFLSCQDDLMTERMLSAMAKMIVREGDSKVLTLLDGLLQGML